MTHEDSDVKSGPGHRKVPRVTLVQKLICWVDCHPRVGWYIAVITTVNTVLTFFSLVH